MKFGVCIPNYGTTLSVEDLRRIALESEKLGYESIWATDHILMSENSGTPYEKILDSMITLAYLASQTTKIKLGISSLIVAMRNPIVVTKQLASIDVLSGGRVMLAIGTGWNEREFNTLGSNFHERGRRVNESIRLIRSLWKGEKDFQGKAVLPLHYTNVSFEPRPVQERLTLWVGGASQAAMRRAARLGDAWHPNVSPLDKFKGLVAQFRDSCPEAKDKPICVRMALNAKAHQAEYVGPQGDRRILLSSNMAQNREIVSELEKLGVTYVVLATNPEGKMPPQDQVAGLQVIAQEFLG